MMTSHVRFVCLVCTWQVDIDMFDLLSALDPNESIAKFGFPVLGLVRKDVHSAKRTVVVTV